MGVSGSGKSTVGRMLATDAGLPFVDADDLHPAANIAKMAAGIPLTDTDRAPWLRDVGLVLATPPVVVACSALKVTYRNRLREFAPNLQIVYLRATPQLLGARLAQRVHEFMPGSLLSSQLETLEPPGEAENPFVLDAEMSPSELMTWFRERAGTICPARNR
ncbi:MAG TPA: gluconokinase [Galbitalea sp.]|jgi:carbohydrate kinase (thermoresistant glucokinase family)|nr:gluconokinase [Galbitalea sp.]